MNCLSISRYIKGGRKSHYEHTRIFIHTCMCEQSILTEQWNYNFLVLILYSYLRYNDRLSDVFLLLAVILSKCYEEPRRKDCGGHASLPPLFLKSYFARNIFWKFAFVSFSKTSKTFLAPAFPESHRGPCVHMIK